MTTGKTIALTRWAFVGKVMSLLFNMMAKWYINTKSILKSQKNNKKINENIYVWENICIRGTKHKQQGSKFKFSHIYKTAIKMYSNPINVQHGVDVVQWLSLIWLCNPMNYSTTGFPVHHQLLELTQTHVDQVGDAILPSHSLSSSSSPAFNLSQYQDLFQRAGSSHQVDGQNTGASASVLPMNIQDWWFPIGLTGLISLQSKGL